MLTANLNGIQAAFERRGKGMPLVLLHGYPLDHTIWEQVVPLLENEADVIMPDLRGFGETEASPREYQLTDLAADTAALLDHLKIEQAVVAGHSMGGYVALAFAHLYPERLLGLGLVASQPLADSPERKAARYQEADQVMSHGVSDVAIGMSAKLTADPALQARLKELILCQSPKGLAGALRAIAERPDSSPYLPDFDFPVCIVHGQTDGLVPVERAREVRAAVKKGHLVEIEKVGHMPMMEAPQVTVEAFEKVFGLFR